MAGALRLIPDLCNELSGLGYVERDGRAPKLVFPNGHQSAGEAVPHFDPISNGLTAGPLNGSKGAPRVSGSTERPVPIRIDPTDLLATSRQGSLAVAVTGAHAQDQIGHLAVATELEFWARDWADSRGENPPLPLVPILCRWLLDRLDWACQHHHALDEFAAALRRLQGALFGLCGYGEPRPETLSAPCPGCHMLTLYRDVDMQRIVCGAGCAELMTEDSYAEYAKRLIKENPS